MPSLTLWYDKPTTEYMSGLPVGNGHIGAMVLGEPQEQRIALNHQWLWRAKKRSREIPKTADKLPEIRRLFFEGKIEPHDLDRLTVTDDPEEAVRLIREAYHANHNGGAAALARSSRMIR